ncbi:MAG TPA: tetratricopeptide repeat protein [Bryobacteraceae bacterium]|nr:tetratricopeptide repeat protein [Bryobacteraceae bacterium]
MSAALLAQQPAAKPAEPQDPRATAYYNFAMGHMYAELAASYGYRSEYVDKAIQHYKAAMQADPSAGFLSEELTDLYMQAGKLRDAVLEAEDMLKRDPENLDARRMLGRIYSRMIGNQQQGRIDENMLRSAIEQYQKIVAKDEKDLDSWLMIGRLSKIGQDSVESEKAYKKALEIEPNNEFALTGLALVYSDLGDNTRALEMWRRLSDSNPDPRKLRALANAYEQARDYRNAANALKRAMELDPKNPEIKKNLAEDLLLSDDAEGALKLYTELAATDPKDAQLWVRLSQIYRQKRDFVKARDAQRRALELAPDNLEIRYNDVNLLEAEGKYAEAITALKNILSSTERKTYATPEQANRLILVERLGLLYRANEQYGEAVQIFEQMPQLDPDSGARSAAQIIDTWRQAKELTKAQQVADAAIQKYPDNRTVRLVRAQLLADVGRTDDAIESLRKVLGGKDDRETHLALAQVYDKAKRYNEMAASLDAAEKLSASDDEKETVLFMRGAMYEKQKQFEKSETEFRKVLKINPENASALNYLGYMLADQNRRLDEAHKLISRALELDPTNGAFLDSLGWANFRLGRYAEAEENLLAAISRSSRDPVVYDHLADVYAKQGKLKDAIAQWERSLKEWEASPKADYDATEVAKVNKKLEGARVRLAHESPKPAQRR